MYINVCGNSKRLTRTFSSECTAEKIEPKKVEPTKAAPGAPEKGGVTVKGLETRKQNCTLFFKEQAIFSLERSLNRRMHVYHNYNSAFN